MAWVRSKSGTSNENTDLGVRPEQGGSSLWEKFWTFGIWLKIKSLKVRFHQSYKDPWNPMSCACYPVPFCLTSSPQTLPTHYAAGTLASLFLELPRCTPSCPRAFAIAILSSWNTLSQVSAFLFLFSFRSLLQGHLLSEAFPGHNHTMHTHIPDFLPPSLQILLFLLNIYP